ncbi:MAG: hypothetical protein RL516_948, partial [Bacteroidota bacterium]
MYASITSEILQSLNEICGTEYVFTDAEQLQNYSHDETEDLKFLPAVVVKPTSVNQIAEIMRIANAEQIPVTPRGA